MVKSEVEIGDTMALRSWMSLLKLEGSGLQLSIISGSSSPGWKAPVVLRLMSAVAGFRRPPWCPSPLLRPPEPLEDMELEELGSRGLFTVGNCGRL